MSADLLRRAAAKLREHANHPQMDYMPAPWRTVTAEVDGANVIVAACHEPLDEHFDHESCIHCNSIDAGLEPIASFIALMHPPVALTLADALDSAATDADYAEAFPRSDEAINDGSNLFAVARAVLREPEVTRDA